MDRIQTVVIGAGVVGLAIGRKLALAGQEVLLLESADAFGTGTSSRNSEVIHAGIYYPQGSLKAKLCVQGRHLLYAYCRERNIAHQQCGKLIVATSSDQVAQLSAIQTKATANGLVGADALRFLSQTEALDMEPALQCEAALWSPSTGIVDSHALMLSYLGDFENAGGLLALNSRFESAKVLQQEGGTQFLVRTVDGTELLAQSVVNAAGLAAPDVAQKFTGMPHSEEMGGLSGAPVLAGSNRVIRLLRQHLGPQFPIIGVGGILSAADAVSKIEAGADVVQIYTGLIYKGPALVHEVAKALKQLSSS